MTDFPKIRNPNKRRNILETRLNWLAVRIPVLPTRTERPVIPPKVKLLGYLKSHVLMIIKTDARVSKAYSFTIFIAGFVISIIDLLNGQMTWKI